MSSILFVGEHARTYTVPLHSHEHWELVYCTAGSGAFRFENGDILEYREGDTVAVPPQVRHTNESEEGFRNIHIRMRDPAFSDRAAFRVTDGESRPLRFAFSQARYYYLSDDRKRELILTALGELIVSYFIVFRSNSSFSAPVEQLRDRIIRDHTDPNFALDEAMRDLPLQYDYLRKLFRREMGMTPLEYRTQLRMKRAAQMLGAMWAPDCSVGEIAQQCGYDDALYFSRVFKKHFGCSPTAYAEKCRHSAAQNESKKQTE